MNEGNKKMLMLTDGLVDKSFLFVFRLILAYAVFAIGVFFGLQVNVLLGNILVIASALMVILNVIVIIPKISRTIKMILKTVLTAFFVAALVFLLIAYVAVDAKFPFVDYYKFIHSEHSESEN